MRRAIMGLTRVARFAGIKQAKRVAPVSTTTTRPMGRQISGAMSALMPLKPSGETPMTVCG